VVVSDRLLLKTPEFLQVGKAYGKTTYLITTFERVPAGTEGAVSLEGTLAGVVGAFPGLLEM
jgi:uncharacterized membrane protein